MIWDQMYSGSQHYGRRGITMMIVSVIDLALWDLLGKIRGEPVYKLIGGADKGNTSPRTALDPIPRSHGVKATGVARFLFAVQSDEWIACRRTMMRLRRIGKKPGLAILSWSTATCRSTSRAPITQLINKCADLDIEWWEEVLSPDDTEGYAWLHDKLFRRSNGAPGEHECTVQLP